jgi:hypothetical protein
MMARALAACLLVASCSSGGSGSAAHPPDLAFDGTFSVEFGLRTTVHGTRVPGTGITVNWVARSSCGDDGCVATAKEFPPTQGGDPRPSTMVFDFVDGHWISVLAAPAQCPDSAGKPIAVDAWQTVTLEPTSDGTMTGSYTNRSSVGGACFSSTQSVTVTRIGGENPLAHVADPNAQPSRVASPALGLWGSYRLQQTNPDTGQVYPSATYAGNTHCLRTGDRCLSYLVEPGTKALLVMTFAGDGWTSTSAPAQTSCGDGQTGTSIITATMPLPKPATDPISALAGSQRTEVTGACTKTLTLEATLQRTGD